MKTILFVLLSLASVALAQNPPRLTSELIASRKFTLLNQVVSLSSYTATAKETSPTESLVDFGNGVTCKFPTAHVSKIDARKNRVVYVHVQSFKDDAINVVILGNHVGYDLNRKAVYSWQQNGDK